MYNVPKTNSGKNISDYLTSPKYLSLAFIIIGLMGIVISLRITNPYTQTIPVALMAGSVFYLITFYQNQNYKPGTVSITFNFKIALIAYIFVVLLSLILYHIYGFDRTVVVHVLTSLLFLITIIIIFSNPKPKLVLPIIILTSIIHRTFIYYSSELYIGNDVFWHNYTVAQIANLGTISSLASSKYYYAPFYHISGASTEIIYGVPTRHAVFLTFVISVVLIQILFIYLISNMFFRVDIALISPILYITADFVIRRSIQPSTTTLGIMFFIVILFLFVKYVIYNSKIHFGLFSVSLIALALTHQLSSIVALVSIASFSFFALICCNEDWKAFTFSTIFVGIVVFSQFLYTGARGGDTPLFQHVLLNAIRHLSTAGTGTRTEFILPPDPTLSPTGVASLTIIHTIGTALLLFLAIYGSLYSLTSISEKLKMHIFGICGIAGFTLILVLLGPLFGMRTLIPWRWFQFIYVPLSILAAPACYLFARRIMGTFAGKYELLKIIVIILIFGPYLILMGGNFAGAYEDPVFDSAFGAQSFQVHYDEKLLYEHSSRYLPDESEVYSDHRAQPKLQYYGVNYRTIRINYGDPNSILEHGSSNYILARGAINQNYASYQLVIDDSIVWVYGPIPIGKMNERHLSNIYNSGNNSLIILNRD